MCSLKSAPSAVQDRGRCVGAAEGVGAPVAVEEGDAFSSRPRGVRARGCATRTASSAACRCPAAELPPRLYRSIVPLLSSRSRARYAVVLGTPAS